MTTTVLQGELQERATATDKLEARLAINQRYASTDFSAWYFDRLPAREGMDVLDVGCGEGAQSVPLAATVGRNGSLSSIDISSTSIEKLRRMTADKSWVQAESGDMADLGSMIGSTFRVKSYDIAQSVYALYYSKARVEVLDAMRSALKPGGHLVVFTPYAPHGLVDLARQFTLAPDAMDELFVFGPQVLEPYFRKHFWDVTIHLFHNELKIPSLDDVLSFYRATTYWSEVGEAGVRAEAERQIAERGYFEYEKNGYLIIGSRQR